MFDNFYFFHIDKTIGRLMGIHMMDPLYPIMEDHGIKSKQLNIDHEAHNYWQNFEKNTYIYATFRDPVERFVSDFVYTVNYEINGYRKWSPGNGDRDKFSPFMNLNYFKDWMNNSAIFNYQSRVLSSNTLDNDIIKERISKINLFIKTESLENNEKNIQEKILKDLNINYKLSDFNRDYEITFYEEMTKNFINDFLDNSLLINEVRNRNSIDCEIYSSIN